MPSVLALLHWGRAFLNELEDNQLAGDPKVSVMLDAELQPWLLPPRAAVQSMLV